jgi:hypothetical protein
MELVTSAGNNLSTPGRDCLDVRLLQHPVNRSADFTAEITATRTWNGKATLCDLSGRALWSTPLTLHPGKNQHAFAAPSMAGIYFLDLAGGCGRVVKIVVK